MAGADRPKDRAELPNKPLMRRVKANACRLLQGMAPGNFCGTGRYKPLTPRCCGRIPRAAVIASGETRRAEPSRSVRYTNGVSIRWLGFLFPNFLRRWPLARQSAMSARRTSYPPCYSTNERGSHNRRSPDAADSTRAASVARSARRLERQHLRSRESHPQGWSKQRKDRLDPVRAVSSAARRLVNATFGGAAATALPTKGINQ